MLDLEKNTIMKSKIVHLIPEIEDDGCIIINLPEGTILWVRICDDNYDDCSLYYILGNINISDTDINISSEDEIYFDYKIKSEVLNKISNFTNISEYENNTENNINIFGVISVTIEIILKY